MAVLMGDPENKDGIVILLRPRWNLCRIASKRLDHHLGEFVEEEVLPSNEDEGVLVFGFFKFVSESIDLRIAVGGVDRELAADGGGLDGDKRAEIVKLATVRLLRGIRRKDEGRFSVLGKKHVG